MSFRGRSWLVVLLGTIVVALALSTFAPAARAAGQESEKKDTKDKGLLIKTPSGSFEASKTPDLKRLGLPVYPGAKYVDDKDNSGGEFGLTVTGKTDIHFVVAKFRTPDSKEKVQEFYQKKLGKTVTKFTPTDEDGAAQFEMKHGKDQRYVGLKTVDGKTEITLVRLEGVEAEDSDTP